METGDVMVDEHELGCVLHVRAAPGAKSNAITGTHQGSLRVSVTQVAEKGKANQAILKVLAKSLSLKKSQLVLVAGETSRSKQVLVRDQTRQQLRAILQELPI